MNEVMDGQVNLFDQDTWYGRTSSVLCQAMGEKTLRQSSKKSSKSQNRKLPIFKCLNMAGQRGGATAMWQDDGAWLIESTMRNGGECPSAAVESRLSQILEEAPPTKYYLSRAACQGILRRAERRGKDLPEQLKQALLIQSASGGCDGGGKGALVQTEKSGTLGTGNDQTLFCMATQQGGAEIRTDDKAPTLTAAAGMSGNNQPVVIPINDKATRFKGGGDTRKNDGSGNGLGIGKDGDPAPTITSADKHIVAAFKSGQGAKAGSIGYEEELSPTLSAVSSGTNQVPAILDMSHANDVIRECGEVVPSLQARMGTGGNQVPLTYQQVTGTLSPGAHAGSYNGQDAYNDMLVAHTLRASGKDSFREDSTTYILSAAVDCRNFTENGDVNGTLQAKGSGGSSLNLNNVCRQSGAVRRLTPLECTRLQGFPDGWVDIGEWTDEKGRVHKEADAPKYKALGNSIALPFWKWLLRRISDYLPEDATLGSLFDGIGGFPLCWAEIHGAENCRWSSEIEPFPIAVVKRHFGDEDAGISGDLDEFLRGPVVR